MNHSKEIKMKESTDYKIDANYRKKGLFKSLKLYSCKAFIKMSSHSKTSDVDRK